MNVLPILWTAAHALYTNKLMAYGSCNCKRYGFIKVEVYIATQKRPMFSALTDAPHQ
jgi:hypothetical protein